MFQTNYWFSFPNSNNDVIIGLTMWQYWWWFWFTYYMCLYYIIFLRLVRYRVLKFSPKIVTSQKSHGKWGDFIVCVVPIAWCVNILSNSNFILRMMEWQTESSLFTVRVRGRQWYWVYKIEIKDLLNVIHTTKNTGHDYWNFNTNISTFESMCNLNDLQLKNHNRDYLNRYKNLIKSAPSFIKSYETSLNSPTTDVQSLKSYPATHAHYVNNCKSTVMRIKASNVKDVKFRVNVYESAATTVERLNRVYCDIKLTPNKVVVLQHNATNSNRRMNRSHDFNVTRYTILLNNLKLVWNRPTDIVIPKTTADNMYFVIKQKRLTTSIKKLTSSDIIKNVNHFSLKNFNITVMAAESNYTTKWAAKKLKYKSPIIPLTYNRRLLRTKRVLVLPSQVNITLITNSFDVVHSWYIPGLGVKLDCIPGRSTHHTLFIDHAGFYYGQCAEICGRYHHHMPIRVCALPFEHFLIWWYHYGLPHFNTSTVGRKTSVRSGIRQYSW